MFNNKKDSLDPDIFRELTEKTNDLISLTKFTPKAEFIYVNPSYLRVLNYKEEELIGKSSLSFTHPDDLKKYAPLLMKYIKNKATNVFTKKQENLVEKIIFRLRKSDGEYLFFEATVNILKDYLVFVCKEITERYKLEESIKKEKKFVNGVINSLPGIFYVIRKDGSYEKWNKNFEKVTGYSATEIEKMNPTDFFDSEDKKIASNAMLDVFNKNRTVMVEARLMNKKGDKIPYYFNGKKLEMGGNEYLIGMGIDISKRKKYEKELLEKNEYLEKMNKAAIDRELKMIELKKKINDK